MLAHRLLDEVGPRLTNSPAYNHALEMLTALGNSWGFQNAGKEAWGKFGQGWSNNTTQLSLQEPYYENMIAYPVPWCKSTQGAVITGVIMLSALDSAKIDSAGDAIKGKIVIIKPGSKNIPENFTPDAKRYTATELDTLPDNYMVSPEEVNQFLPFIKKMYYTKLYLEKKGAIALISSNKSSVDGTVFVDGMGGYSKDYAATLPELKITREDYLKLSRLVENKNPVKLSVNIQILITIKI